MFMRQGVEFIKRKDLCLMQLRTLYSGFLLFLSIPVVAGESKSQDRPLRVAYFGQDIAAVHHLSPAIDPDSASVFANIFDSLVHPSLDGEIKPALATSWERTSPTRWEFTLRKGVKFHDGSEFTADDVKFNFDFIRNPENRAGYAGLWSTIKTVEVAANDPYKVIFETVNPDASFLHMMLEFGSIPCAKAIREKGMAEFDKNPIGSGPYRFKTWERGKKIVLERNPNYWDPSMPKINTIEYLIAPEEKWLSMITKNEVDLVPNLSGRHANKLVMDTQGKAKIIKRRVLISYWFMLRNTGALADKRVRQALNYAINRDEIIKFADYGNGLPLCSLGKRGELGASPEELPCGTDLDKAKALLKEAGYPKGFKMKILVADSAAAAAKVMRGNLAKIGVDLSLEVVSRTKWTEKVVVHKILNQGKLPDYDGLINLVDNPVYNMAFHGIIFLFSQGPFSMLNSPEFDQRLGQAIGQPDLASHTKALEILDKYIHEEALMVFTTQRILTVAANSDLSIDTFNQSGHLGRYILSTAEWKK